MNEGRKPCYVLCKSDGAGQFPMYRTTEGKVALLLFTSRESAQAFADGMGMSSAWAVRELSQADTAEWVREAVRSHGASGIAVDPDPATAAARARVIPAVVFLIELEG